MNNSWLLLVIAGLFGILGLKLTSTAKAQTTTERTKMISFYIGGYAGADNKGIYRAMLNIGDGTMSKPTLAVETRNASFLAIHPTLPVVYAALELGKPLGAVAAFAIAEDGALTPAGQQSSKGDSPCYVSTDPSGHLLFEANYGDGLACAFALDAKGSISDAVVSDQHAGFSVVKGRQDGPHAHSFLPDRSGRLALSADLGTDEIFIYRVQANSVERIGAAKSKAGSGPRHIAVSADNKFVYICNELSNTMTTFAFNADAAPADMLRQLDDQSTLPEGFAGQSACAEIALHPSGRFLYVSNRGHDSLAVFRIDPATGRATAAGQVSCGGHEPRHFAIEPGGRFLVVANQKSNDLVAFSIDADTGMLSPTGSSISVGSPSCVRFAR